MIENERSVSDQLLRLIPAVGIVLILGSEGSGKSVLGYGILDDLKGSGRPLFAYNFPLENSIYLPDFIGVISTLDFPEGAIIIVDEAYLKFHSRGSMKGDSKYMDTFSGLVRQKEILVIYITQTSRKLDIGLVSSPRVLLIKQPSLLQMRLDRSELRPIIADAAKAFDDIERQAIRDGESDEVLKAGELGADTMVNPRCLVATYVVSNRFEGIIQDSNRAPSFWSEGLSKAWKGINLLQEATSFTPSSDLICCEIGCNNPIIGICSCHGNGYCEEHMKGHTMSSKSATR